MTGGCVKKLLKILLIIISIIVMLYILTIIVTNIIYSLNENKYELRSYGCCNTKTEFMGQIVHISPAAPCSCKDKDIELTMIQKMWLVLGKNPLI